MKVRLFNLAIFGSDLLQHRNASFKNRSSLKLRPSPLGADDGPGVHSQVHSWNPDLTTFVHQSHEHTHSSM